MRAILNRLLYPSRSYATKAWTAMLVVLTICLCTAVASAQTAPLQAINVSQVNWLNPVLKGGVDWGDDPYGQNFAVNSNGDIFLGTNQDLEKIDGKTGVITSIIGTNTAGFSAINGVAIDAQNNLYVSEAYDDAVWKVPYLGNGAYAAFDDGTATACANFGTNSSLDTVTCTMPNLVFAGDNWYFQIENIAVDAQGDLFWEMLPSYGAGAVWECSLTCLAGTTTPILIFQEPAATPQFQIGGLAFDPWGNLFFNDGSSTSTNLNELPVSTGAGYGGATTGFAAAPTVLYSYATPGSGDQIDGVAVDPVTGTVYIAFLYSGIYAFPNSAGVVNTAQLYGISPQGAKTLALDGNNNPIIVSYHGAGDTVGRILVNNLSFPGSVQAGSSVSSAYNTTVKIGTPPVSTVVTGSYVAVVDNMTTCTTDPTLTLAATGGSAAEFTVASTSIVPPATALLNPPCSGTVNGGASYPVTVGFTPSATAVGKQTASITATDSASNSGTATAAGSAPAIFVTQVNWLNNLAGGGALASGNAAGSTFGVNSATGDIIISNTYGNKVLDINTTTGAETLLVDWGSDVGDNYNVGPVALDSQNNLYVGGLYTNNVIKIPFVSGAYVAAPDPTNLLTYPADCTGTDTAECSFGSNLTNITNGYYFGVSAMTFDAAGDFFFSLTNANTAPEAIYECTAACIATGTPAATMIYMEPASTTAAQLMVGGLAIDPWGNLFFTDSSYNGSKNESIYSELNELPVSTGVGYGGVTTGYAAAPTVIYTETLATPGSYDDELDGVAVDQVSGTVYLADQYNGIFAFQNNAGTVNPAGMYTVSTQGAKILALDAMDNLYGAVYSSAITSGGADTAFKISVNNVLVPGLPGIKVNGATNPSSTQVGTTANTTYNTTVKVAGVNTVETGSYVTVVDNGTTCTVDPTISFSVSGTNAADFAGEDTAFIAPATALLLGVCNGTMSGAASYPTTVSFTPSLGATETATLTVMDAASSSGSATVSGVGQALIPQHLTFTAPTASESVAYGVAPITVTATTDSASGIPVVVTIDGASTPGAGTLTAGVLTVNSAGTIILDANEAGDGVTYAAANQVQITITVTQLPQAITFTNPTASETIAYNTNTIDVTATGGLSGNPVTFSVTGPATLGGSDGATLTLTGPGSVVVTANQLGNTNYSDAPAATLTITVTQAAQAITFTNPAASETIPYSAIPIVLAATGGASGNSVLFSVTGPATLAADGVTLTLTGVGSVVVTANQAGNANYSAAPAASLTITVSSLGQVAEPTFSIPAGTYYGSANKVALSTTTSGATIYYTTNGSIPTTSSTKYTGAIPLATVETITINAIAVDSPGYTNSNVASATYIVSAGVPDFTFAVSPTALNLTAGNSGEVDAVVTGSPDTAAFLADVLVACTGLPLGASCDALTIAPSGSSVAKGVLKINTSSASISAHNNSNPLVPGGATLAAALCCFLGFKKRRRLQMMLLLAVSAIGLSLFTGCGAQWSPTFSVSSVKVTAVSKVNGVQLERVAYLTLTVNK